MNKATIIRFDYGPRCTRGYLYCGDLRLVTLEEPWTPDPDGPGGQRKEPGHYESCIPDGIYHLLPHNTEKYPNVWRLSNPLLGVYGEPKPAGQKWGREAILIHSGNVLDHTLGCILVGLDFDGPERIKGGTSRIALEKLRGVLGSGPDQLEIRPTMGTSETLPNLTAT